jgi:hypothetical protein
VIRWEYLCMCRGLHFVQMFAFLSLFCRVGSYRYDSKMVRKTEVGRTYASIGITYSVVTKRMIKRSAHLCNRRAVISKASC